MPTFQIADDVIPMSALRENLAGYVKQAQETKRPLLLTQNGRSAVVMMDATVFDSLREQLHKLSVYEDLLVSEGQLQRGETLTTEELERELEADEQNWAPSRKRSTGKSKTNRLTVAV